MNIITVLLLPILAFAGSILVILIDAFIQQPEKKSYPVSIAILVLALIGCFYQWNTRGTVFGGMYVLDSFSLVACGLFALAALVAIILTHNTPQETAQFHALVLLALVGMMMLAGGAHFLMLFIALELLSLSVYVLAAFAKKDPKSAESGLKYFLLGSFASAFFLYGVAFIYGATGTLQINEIATSITKATSSHTLLYLGVVFLLIGFAFKISLAPFHMWAPDVYEGAPTPVTAFMAATVKAAALAALIRTFLVAFPGIAAFWGPMVWVLAVVTMFFGNLTALWQDNLKRLLAYSSIAHAGYMLVGLMADPVQVQQSILYYFAAYVFMNLGAFTVISYLENQSQILEISEYRGLAYNRPVLATCMTLFLLSLGGLPPTAGFFGKFYLFRAVLQAGHVWIVVLAVINSAISFYYYLRVVISMFTPEKEAAPAALRLSTPLLIVLALMVFGTIALGLFPNLFIQLARTVSILS